MNMSQLVTRIKLSCGLYALATPFNVDEMIVQVIKDITRRTFSSFAPVKERMRFDIQSMEILRKDANLTEFLLPDIFTAREITQVINIEYDDSNIMSLGYIGGGMPLNYGSGLNQAMLANANLHLTNTLIPRISFKYEHPRKITVYNAFISNKFMIDLGFMHDENLASISTTQEEQFFNLAVLDVKDALYQSMKHYTDINTAYGNISLKLDDWAQAADQRKALVDEWRAIYHIDIIPLTFG